MSDDMNIQWYPGHMAKTKRLLSESVKLADVILEVVDARLPYSSRNPFVEELSNGRKHIMVFNKLDLADKAVTEEWARFYEKKGVVVVRANCLTGEGVGEIESAARRLCAERQAALKAKGVLTSTIRAMCVGIPNVGKSTLINRYAKKQIAKTEDRPGVTRNRQWIKVKKDFEILDTPGILWGKFDEPQTGLYIALTGGVTDKITDTVTLAYELIKILGKLYGNYLEKRYGILITSETDCADILNMIGRKRGHLVKGGEVDLTRASAVLLDEFRAGKLGGVTLDRLLTN